MPAQLNPLTISGAPPIALNRPVVFIGRHPECDVQLLLPEISRRHCCFAFVDDRLVVRDLGSRNGVRVNGRTVEQAVLAFGDEVAVAHVIYRVVDPDAPGTGQAGGQTKVVSPPRGSPSPTPPKASASPPAAPPPAIFDSDEALIPID